MKCELLAPAGSIEALHAALMAGADAVYIGGSRFGARAYASNAEEKDLLEAIDLVHRLGKKLYMTVNTLVKDEELERELYAWMKPYVLRGLDGVIIQDFGAVSMFKRLFPELPLHASTQMAVTGPEGTRFLQQAGLVRVVPAREVSLKEIRRIHEETGMEIESFVHGAMCYSYSGMCLMSSLIGGRSGNRGRCAGVCRLPFDVYEGRKHLNGPDTHYPLNMKDMCTIDILPDLIEAGVISFKIEGRMKKPEYTAGVVSVYRKYLDLYENDPKHYKVSDADRRKLWELFNRDGFNQSCYYEHNGRDMIALKNEKLNDVRQKAAQELLAGIRTELNSREMQKKLQAPVEGAVFAYAGQNAGLTVTWTSPEGEPLTVYAEGAEVQTAKNQPLTEERIRKQMEKTGESAFRFSRLDVEIGDGIFIPMQNLNELRRTAFRMLDEEIRAFYARQEVPAEVLAEEERKPLSAKEENGYTDGMLAETETSADRAGTGMDDPEIHWIQIETPEQLYPVLAFAEMEKQIGICLPQGFWVKDSFIDSILSEEEKKKIRDRICEQKIPVRIVLPYIMRERGEERIHEAVQRYLTFDGRKGGILIRNLEELGYLKRIGAENEAVMDALLYTWNGRAGRFFSSYGFVRHTVTPELNEKELRRRDNHCSEMEIYGRVPMMISVHCLQKTLKGCNHGNARLTLRDRKGTAFTACSCCNDCYSVIYNSLPTSLLRDREAVEKLHMQALRLHFTEENAEETKAVLQGFSDFWINKKKETAAELPQSTRGHFRRGVE
ncbi:MAG: U32 family peptidase [Eubacteriales bacterium]|nr:U32 family peptidase [Eubacteriales bacterium]